MKYTKGTPTIIGPIEKINDGARVPYMVKTFDCHWFTESEIDAIVIKPKRNIDHLIELIEAKKRKEAVSFITDRWQSTSWSFWLHMLDEYTEPRKYPVLTPDEPKAVKWLVDGGYIAIQNYKNENAEASYGTDEWFGTEWMPIAKCLCNSDWITETPINLKELLEALSDCFKSRPLCSQINSSDSGKQAQMCQHFSPLLKLPRLNMVVVSCGLLNFYRYNSGPAPFSLKFPPLFRRLSFFIAVQHGVWYESGLYGFS